MNPVVNAIASDLSKIRENKPLIHHITNFVVMNETANATLCIGALPVMAHAKEEVEEMVCFASALLLNIGTLTPELIDSMVLAGKKANELGVPIVFDPVGAGATALRTDACKRILNELDIAIIRGNSAEIGILAGAGGEIKGVEAIGTINGMAEIAQAFAAANNFTVSVTGATDIVTDGMRVALIKNGDPIMATVTGTGCISTTITAAFAAVQNDTFLAATGALVAYGIAGENAARVSGEKPGTFHACLYDALYELSPEDIIRGAKVEVIQPVSA
ncbi:MAG TPA: hydroxyethylthiazole kinase [Candidatus Aquicultor sp.]|jgi:hydroxyethylthiazole kinase